MSFHCGAQHYLAAPVAPAVTANNATLAMSFTVRDIFPSALLQNGNIQALGLFTFTSSLLCVAYDGTNWITPAAPPIGSQVEIVARTSPTGIKASVVVDGVRSDYSTAVTVSSASIPGANWNIGWDGASTGNQLQGAISQAIVVSRSISDTENDALLAWLAANPSTHLLPTNVPSVIITGDSIARGLGLEANRAGQWPFLAQSSLDSTQPVNLINAAASGNTIALQQAVYPSLMLPFYNASRARNIFVGAIGVNDMRTLLHDGPTTLASYYNYMDQAKADGWRVVACSILPTNAGGSFNTSRAYFNSHLAAEWAARGYSAFADVASIVGMGADGDDANLIYYQDNLHPTFAGDALMAPVYAAATQAALN